MGIRKCGRLVSHVYSVATSGSVSRSWSSEADEGCERVGEDDDEEGSVSDEERERISNAARQGRVDGQSHSRRIVWPIRCGMLQGRSSKTHQFPLFRSTTGSGDGGGSNTLHKMETHLGAPQPWSCVGYGG